MLVIQPSAPAPGAQSTWDSALGAIEDIISQCPFLQMTYTAENPHADDSAAPRSTPTLRPATSTFTTRPALMMQPFICSYRNKNEPTAIYPSFWVLPHTEKKRGTCDDASTITLVVQWWFSVPFGTRGRVYILCRVTTLSAHLYK